MKNFVHAAIALVVFTLNLNAQTIEDLRKSKNPFKEKGEEFYNFLNKTVKSAQNKEFNLKEFIKETENENFKFKTNISKEYIENNKKYFERINLDINSLLKLENEILNEGNLDDSDGMLETISYFEWSTLYASELNQTSKLCIRCWEACADRCMVSELNAIFGPNGNWIKKTLFIASAAQSTLAMYASCSWDCGRNYASH